MWVRGSPVDQCWQRGKSTFRIITSEFVNSHFSASVPAASAARISDPRCLLRAKFRKCSRQIPVKDETSSSVKSFCPDLIFTTSRYLPGLAKTLLLGPPARLMPKSERSFISRGILLSYSNSPISACMEGSSAKGSQLIVLFNEKHLPQIVLCFPVVGYEFWYAARNPSGKDIPRQLLGRIAQMHMQGAVRWPPRSVGPGSAIQRGGLHLSSHRGLRCPEPPPEIP